MSKCKTNFSSFNWVKNLLNDRNLSSNAVFVGLYLSTYMNQHSDIAFPSLSTIAGHTKLSKPTVIKYINELERLGWLLKKKRSSVTKGGKQVHNEYWINIPDKVVKEIYHLDEGSKNDEQRWLNSQQKVVKELNPNNNIITNNNNKRVGNFVPPSLEEVTEYCKQRNNHIDPEQFIAFYQSKNWYVGKNKMKCWKSAIITWEKRDQKDRRNDNSFESITSNLVNRGGYYLE